MRQVFLVRFEKTGSERLRGVSRAPQQVKWQSWKVTVPWCSSFIWFLGLVILKLEFDFLLLPPKAHSPTILSVYEL